ncbi:hypothetical protein LZ32DRAFT_655918 [Colletotrichum eremochloae]|nr:hypothetical protein LZ32DRAFT_655918 [Colletotrichum eremochloae]
MRESSGLSLWDIERLKTEEAVIVGHSIPLVLILTTSIGLTQAMAENDKTVHGDAKKAGFGIKHGHGYDLAGYQLMKGGQYYIDQEASRMTIKWEDQDPKIRGGTKEFQSDGLRLGNGTKLEVDVVVLVTGCESNATTIQKLFGPEVAKIDIGSMRHE